MAGEMPHARKEHALVGQSGAWQDSSRTRSRRQKHLGGKRMDIISVPTFWTIWLLFHLIVSVGLLGALTHQAVAVMVPVRKMAGPGGFVTRFRAVPAAGSATAVCVLWVLTSLT